MKQDAFDYTYLVNICEGCWEESFYCYPWKVRLFTGWFITDDTLACAITARETINLN